MNPYHKLMKSPLVDPMIRRMTRSMTWGKNFYLGDKVNTIFSEKSKPISISSDEEDKEDAPAHKVKS